MSFSRKPLLIVLILSVFVAMLLPAAAMAQANDAAKQKVFRKVAMELVASAKKQQQRGLHAQAERSLLQAKKYEQYLTADQQAQLNSLLRTVQGTATQRDEIAEHIKMADVYIGQGDLIRARAHLETAKNNEQLTEQERKQIDAALKQIEGRLGNQKKEITELYNRSVKLYRTGQLEQARAGFVKVAASGLLVAEPGKTAEDYIARIDSILGVTPTTPPTLPQPETGTAMPTIPRAQPETAVTMPRPQQPTRVEIPSADITIPVIEHDMTAPAREPEASIDFGVPQQPQVGIVAPQAGPESSYMDQVRERINIRRGFTRMVVQDANDQVRSALADGSFEQARQAVNEAEQVVETNQLQLGDELYNFYRQRLITLREQIAAAEEASATHAQLAREQASFQAQEEYRQRMAAERDKRIVDLMASAKEYQKQQRYEQALGQLESLLVLDPQNEEALVLRDTLEDTVSFRNQLELHERSRKETVGILLAAEEAEIPYADEINYPRNWKELYERATRKEEGPIGQDPADKETYNQLEKMVDLSDLSPVMTFGEALDIMKTSVDPPLRVIVNWRDLQDTADIDQDTQTNMDPIAGVKLGTALDRLLELVGGGFIQLAYVVENGVVTIATSGSLPQRWETLVYDVSILLSQPSTQQLSPMMGMQLGRMFGGGGYGGGGYGGGGYGGGGYGGGGYGGGMGGYGGGMGGYGGGMGGYGGGMMGGMGGGMMGGMGGGMMGGGYGQGQQQQTLQDRQDDLLELIQETIEPDSWFDAGGEGTISFYEGKKLVVRQTPEVHRQLDQLLRDMRKSLGHQISIEARFILVGENFLEDIGVDIDFRNPPSQELNEEIDPNTLDPVLILGPSGKFFANQDTVTQTAAAPTSVAGSLGEFGPGFEMGWQGWILDCLQADVLVKATQAHRDSKNLVAPKATVLSGETASFATSQDFAYALQPIQSTRDIFGTVGGGVAQQSTIPQVQREQGGTTLNISPTITPDKKHVILNVNTMLRELLGFKSISTEQLNSQGQVVTTTQELPEFDTSYITTRVNVPDGGTLLIGGLKRSAQSLREADVPILGKIPILGRMFANKSEIRDQRILLILIKPTIILEEETDAEALASLE